MTSLNLSHNGDVSAHIPAAMREDGLLPVWKRQYAVPVPANLNCSTLNVPHGQLQIEHCNDEWIVWPQFPRSNGDRYMGIRMAGELDHIERDAPAAVADALEALAADLRAIVRTDRIEEATP